MDSHFPNPAAYGFHITEISELGSIESSEDSSANFPIFKAVEPRIERVGGE
jgi:hypothetical protein